MNSERRPYRSELRTQQSDLTRTRVARTAAEMFVRDGYAGTTVAGVAREAGVSAQTVYNTFGTKAALLKTAYDLALAGDPEPIPFAERPEVRALYTQPDAATFLRGYARLGRQVLDRVGSLLLLITSGAGAGDPDLVTLRDTTNSERLRGTGMVAQRLADLGALSPNVSVAVARDRIWTLNSVEVWHLLTGTRGWSGEAYQDWIGDAMCAATLPPERW